MNLNRKVSICSTRIVLEIPTTQTDTHPHATKTHLDQTTDFVESSHQGTDLTRRHRERLFSEGDKHQTSKELDIPLNMFSPGYYDSMEVFLQNVLLCVGNMLPPSLKLKSATARLLGVAPNTNRRRQEPAFPKMKGTTHIGLFKHPERVVLAPLDASMKTGILVQSV